MVISQMSLSNEYTDNFFIGESLILNAHLRLLFRAFHYETPCRPKIAILLIKVEIIALESIFESVNF